MALNIGDEMMDCFWGVKVFSQTFRGKHIGESNKWLYSMYQISRIMPSDNFVPSTIAKSGKIWNQNIHLFLYKLYLNQTKEK